jgi:hypothetical protein
MGSGAHEIKKRSGEEPQTDADRTRRDKTLYIAAGEGIIAIRHETHIATKQDASRTFVLLASEAIRPFSAY